MLFGYSLSLEQNTETDVNMEVEIVAVYYGTSVDRSLKVIRHVWIIVACRCPTQQSSHTHSILVTK